MSPKTSVCECASFLVDLESDNVMTVLIRDEHEVPVGRELEISRNLAKCRFMTDKLELPIRFIDRKDCDTVVPPVTAVDKLAIS